ncbi:MAG: hypothetical protein CL484_12925 [Acidobacteria bacterium]|nr:hypothetical protein [Acidobacteriota bacterium]|tara:strand:+ start:752 stop:1201 length:450 start_codon:yes stop_codon:yes gene_type:complete
MPKNQQLGPAGHLLFWILASVLFFVIALLPYWLMMDYTLPPDYPVRTTVFTSAAAIFVLLWFATTYGQMKTSASPIAPIGTGIAIGVVFGIVLGDLTLGLLASALGAFVGSGLGTGNGPIHATARAVFILLQILILPLAILAAIQAFAR